MNAKIPVFVICVKAIIYLLLHNLHDCNFNENFDLTVRFPEFTLVAVTILVAKAKDRCSVMIFFDSITQNLKIKRISKLIN